MTSLPPSFSSNPDQDPHKYFKNILIAFKKEINAAVDINELQDKMQTLLNASKVMYYTDTRSKSIFHKPETKKSLDKVFKEFDRYILTIQKDPSKANAQDLLDAISLVEALLSENEIY
ncbi:MAG: hypothetical protein KR126chlam6_00822 [Candidatus Anoxychlamydiales bacterium]|nr:hypothetical protein [Candidatus Anoxychlamydiales bacterium]